MRIFKKKKIHPTTDELYPLVTLDEAHKYSAGRIEITLEIREAALDLLAKEDKGFRKGGSLDFPSD